MNFGDIKSWGMGFLLPRLLFGNNLKVVARTVSRIGEQDGKHQNRPSRWRGFSSEKNFRFSFWPIQFFIFRDSKKRKM